MMKQPRCLIFGANGFIGSHMVDKLASSGYGVTAFDRFSKEPQFKISANVEALKADFFDDQLLAKALEGVDYVFHLFSATTPFVSDNDPYIDITKNILRSVQFLEMAVEAHIKKVIFVSSGGAVYGEVAENKAAKETDTPNPVSPYGIGKLATENYLAYFKRKYNLDYIVYRLTNPYGPRQATNNNQGVIPAFLQQVQKGQKLTIYGDGTNSRDFIYIHDAIKMITDTFHTSAKHSIYNIGSGQQTDLNTIIKTVEKITGIFEKNKREHRKIYTRVRIAKRHRPRVWAAFHGYLSSY
jgi:UDP-glucose 4-epimerase